MTPPLIGLPGRRKHGRQIVGFPDSLGDVRIDLYLADYATAVLEAGGIPVHLPFDVDPAAVAPRLDGVLLSGGGDIEPARYDAEPHPEVMDVDSRRDDFEFGLYNAAVDGELPVLGICRGLQVINIAHGGTLDQHIPEHLRFDLAPDTEIHDVAFEPGSTVHDLYGPTRQVNSLHHQRVDVVGSGLSVTGRAPDGTVEAFEAGTDTLAVQWHPEMMESRATDPVFDWLIERASNR